MSLNLQHPPSPAPAHGAPRISPNRSHRGGAQNLSIGLSARYSGRCAVVESGFRTAAGDNWAAIGHIRSTYSGSKAPGFPIQYRHLDGPLRDCDGNRLLRPSRILPGNASLMRGAGIQASSSKIRIRPKAAAGTFQFQRPVHSVNGRSPNRSKSRRRAKAAILRWQADAPSALGAVHFLKTIYCAQFHEKCHGRRALPALFSQRIVWRYCIRFLLLETMLMRPLAKKP